MPDSKKAALVRVEQLLGLTLSLLAFCAYAYNARHWFRMTFLSLFVGCRSEPGCCSRNQVSPFHHYHQTGGNGEVKSWRQLRVNGLLTSFLSVVYWLDPLSVLSVYPASFSLCLMFIVSGVMLGVGCLDVGAILHSLNAINHQRSHPLFFVVIRLFAVIFIAIAVGCAVAVAITEVLLPEGLFFLLSLVFWLLLMIFWLAALHKLYASVVGLEVAVGAAVSSSTRAVRKCYRASVLVLLLALMGLLAMVLMGGFFLSTDPLPPPDPSTYRLRHNLVPWAHVGIHWGALIYLFSSRRSSSTSDTPPPPPPIEVLAFHPQPSHHHQHQRDSPPSIHGQSHGTFHHSSVHSGHASAHANVGNQEAGAEQHHHPQPEVDNNHAESPSETEARHFSIIYSTKLPHQPPRSSASAILLPGQVPVA